jgi:hypothetical protein
MLMMNIVSNLIFLEKRFYDGLIPMLECIDSKNRRIYKSGKIIIVKYTLGTPVILLAYQYI